MKLKLQDIYNMDLPHSTYTKGFTMVMERDITFDDLLNICKDLNEMFDYKHRFAPEPICDGFIYFKDYNDDGPSRYDCRYKSMRINPHRIKWIYEDTVFDDWKGDKDIFIPKTDKYEQPTTTFLKAFRGADAWTIDELNMFKSVFGRYGIQVKKMPSKKSLKVT